MSSDKILLVYIYFADWTNRARLRKLAEKGVPLGGRIIKAYASPIDPAILIGGSLIALKISGEEFDRKEVFNYGSRFKLNGEDLEKHMFDSGLSEEGKKYLRTIFRFGNLEPVRVIDFAMQISVNGNWYFEHPLDPVHGPIHGIDEAIARPFQRIPAMHLDIFTERTLQLLSRLVDFNDPTRILNEREAIEVIKEIRSFGEGNLSGKERS